MPTYISLLRGINIGGRNIIKMEALRAAYAELGFSNIKSYIQSGNLVFSSDSSNSLALAALIYDKIETTFGLKIPTLVLSADDFKSILVANTMANESETDAKNPSELHVIFLAEALASPEKIAAIALLKHEKEMFAWQANAIFIYCPDGYHKSKIHNNHIESQLKTAATTRNWRSCQKILELL
jgi:uncharacterized protein (DUF1697 family)